MRDAGAPCALADAARADVGALVGDGRLERALHSLAAADRACPAERARSRRPRAEILAALGRWDALAPVLDAIVGDPASGPADRRAAAELRDRRDVALHEPPPTDAARRTARDLRERARAAADPRVARELYLRAWDVAHPDSLALAGAARASALAGDLVASRRLYERAAAEAEREAGAPLAIEIPHASEAIGFADHGALEAIVIEQKLPWPAADPTRRSTVAVVDRRTRSVERALASEVGVRFATRIITPYVAFDPAGRSVFVGTDAEVRRIDVDSGRVLQRFPLVRDNASAWALSPDGTLLARWGHHGLELVEVATGVVRREIALDPGSPAMAFSPDGRRIATATEDVCDYETCGGDLATPRVRLHDVATGAQLGTYGIDALSLQALRFTHDGKRLVALVQRGQDGDRIVLDGQTCAYIGETDGAELAAHAAALGIGDELTSRRAAWPQREPVAIEGVGLAGDMIALRLPDRLVAWSTTGDRALREPTMLVPADDDSRMPVFAGAFSPSGEQFAVPSGDRDVALYEVRSGRRLARFDSACPRISTLALDPARLAAGCSWSGMSIGSIHGPLFALGLATHPIDTIAVAGGTLAWADREHGAALLAGSGQPIALGAESGPALALSRDGRWLAAGARDGLQIWDVVRGERARTFSIPGSRFAYAQFSPDAQLVFIVGSTSAAYDAVTGAERYTFAPYTGSIYAYAPRSPGLVFGPHATVFASPVESGEVVLVRTADGRQLGTLYAWGDGTGAVIAADGRFALLGGATELPDAMCRAGGFALPFDACRDRFETPDLLATLLAGDPR